MRRLYSTFAGGWPGVGLLLMRAVGGSALIVRANSTMWGTAPLHASTASACLAGCGILLITGLWTPIAGALVGVIAVAEAVIVAGDRSAAILLGTIGAALAMLGPGLWSVDARLFGWKRVEAPPRKATANQDLPPQK